MGLTIADSYYLKAKSAIWGFCGDWEEACEALNYALSYDETHCPSLCLLGEIYAKNLSRFSEAFACFDQVIAVDNSYVEVYPLYVKYLIWAEEQERAKKLIDFALTIKGVGRGSLLQLSSYIHETQGEYKTSLKQLKEAKKEAYNDNFFGYLEDEEERIKKKRKLNRMNGKKKKKVKKRNKKRKK
ncbi:tetratricopeptide repeat protein [Spongiimicrobium salis]|uniref:tetratricopeptide repeat protein n=1 Tax=Spongiimicrobium salis TaxID=1667022 RepID=UPI00374CCEE1